MKCQQILKFGLPLFIGLLFPLGFAPFHFPGLSILSVGLFYLILQNNTLKSAAINGLLFGLGFFSFGVSWIYVSVHTYGHLAMLVAAFITFIFILYLSLYYVILGASYSLFAKYTTSSINRGLFFSFIWVVLEYTRACFLTGFPWLLLGISQFDSPLSAYLPILGVYGTSFLTCIVAICFAYVISAAQKKRLLWLIAGLSMLLLPNLFAQYNWTTEQDQTISVAAVQANLSMRDKWDENLFWQILENYETKIQLLLGTDLIVLPESAIPLPADYLHDTLLDLNNKTQTASSALILGIPITKSKHNKTTYHNGMLGLGFAKGKYLKQHLVPFGEYIPTPLLSLSKKISLPDPELSHGPNHQHLIKIKGYPIAALICYELAYSELLRTQLPQANWIISLSDDGWFGHSLAIYQQLQIAQVRSKQTGRYQVVSINDGLTSILNHHGDIIASLPIYATDILKATLHPVTGSTPWVIIGDNLIIWCIFILLLLQMLFTLARTPK